MQRPVKSVRKALHRFQQVSSHMMPRLRQAIAVTIAVAFVLSPTVSGPLGVTAQAAPRMNPSPAGGAAAGGGCALKSAHGDIQHVIYIQLDNVHFTRDNPNVPSDLELMPNLLNFITDNGRLMANLHTPLKSHTADDIITSETGVYGDRHGQPVANSFDYFTPTGSPFFTSSFQY